MPVGQLSIRADHDSRPLGVLDCFGDDCPLYKGRQRGTHHVLGAAVDRQMRLEHFVTRGQVAAARSESSCAVTTRPGRLLGAGELAEDCLRLGEA